MAKKTTAKKKKPKTAAERKKHLSRKKTGLDKRRKKLESLEKKLGKVDKDLAIIEEELSMGPSESVLVDQDIEGRRETLALDVEEGEGRPGDRRFYRNFVLRCQECKRQFEREIQVKTVQKRLYCPACGKDHIVGIHPSTRIHNLTFPKSLKLVKRK